MTGRVPHLLFSTVLPCGAVGSGSGRLSLLPFFCSVERPHLRFAPMDPSKVPPKVLLFGMTVTLGFTWLGLGLGLGLGSCVGQG